MVGDGANGTGIEARGFKKHPCDLANLLRPELVREVHKEFVNAGADFIETNTFSAGRLRLQDLEVDVDVAELNFAGAALARQAAGDKVFVLGAIGPSGKPLEPIGHITEADVTASVVEQAEALAEGGVDAFILETFIDMRELELAIAAVRSVSKLPIVASKAFIEDGEMLAEGLPARCAQRLSEIGADIVGANCIVGPQRMLDLIRMMAESTEVPLCAFPTPGLPQLMHGRVAYDSSPDYFARAAARLFEEGARIVGGCCGTRPDHIRALKQLVQSQTIKVRPRGAARVEARQKANLIEAEGSELSHKLGKKFVTSVEMDLPRGLDLEKLLNGARQLKIAGIDTINISDGARARLRMNPIAVCAMLRREVGVDCTVHFACRDRNLLAVQSDLLGCHALGVRNILCVTGDPANIGDYPSATSVFDIDSVGLIRILSRFNEGIDLAGYTIATKAAYTIFAAYNPCALDQKEEDDRLRKKAEAGVDGIYTQPVFDQAGADAAATICGRFGLPVLIGVMPLRSARHCEFMHNEVPGISIPQNLRDRFASAPDDETARQIGEEEATKLSLYIKTVGQGLYIMPPANQYSVAQRLIEVVR